MNTTPLHPAHLSLAAQMIEFGGWDMPARYGSAIQEHHAVRSHTGMFDVSHMGRLFLDGSDAEALADSIVTADVTSIPIGRARYCMACNPDGGILDDLIVYRLPDQRIFIVCNASNRDVIVQTLTDRLSDFPNAGMVDRTRETAMIAVQGPSAASTVQSLLPFNPDNAPIFSIAVPTPDTFIARTGYTGEDGVEIIVNADAAIPLWDRLRAAGVEPCGLIARDSLRLESSLRLYGNDMNTSVNPFEAGLGRFVDLTAGPFTGKEALAQGQATRPQSPARRFHHGRPRHPPARPGHPPRWPACRRGHKRGPCPEPQPGHRHGFRPHRPRPQGHEHRYRYPRPARPRHSDAHALLPSPQARPLAAS